MDEQETVSAGAGQTAAELNSDEAPGLPAGESLPAPLTRQSAAKRIWRQSAPFVLLVGYYLALGALVFLLASLFPAVREAFFTPVMLTTEAGGADSILQGSAPAVPTQVQTLEEAAQRSLTTFWVIVGALLLVVPVAGVYMQSKRLQYDPALVRSVVILPIVVAGIAMVVKNSVALAFALAGIVAAVRFRNTLKDPRDAVYIFLVIGIGLASGVQALDVALVMSMLFNFVVLGLWRFNVGSIYGGGYGRTGVLTMGDPGLWVAQVAEIRKRIRRSVLEQAEQMDVEGILLVHVTEIELARHTVQEAIAEMAKEWQMVRIARRSDEVSTLEYIIRLKKKATPADLVGALVERWSAQVLSAEYFPFRLRSAPRKGDTDTHDEDDDS